MCAECINCISFLTKSAQVRARLNAFFLFDVDNAVVQAQAQAQALSLVAKPETAFSSIDLFVEKTGSSCLAHMQGFFHGVPGIPGIFK